MGVTCVIKYPGRETCFFLIAFYTLFLCYIYCAPSSNTSRQIWNGNCLAFSFWFHFKVHEALIAFGYFRNQVF